MRYLRIITVLAFFAVSALLGLTLYHNAQKDVTPPVITDAVGDMHLSVVDYESKLLQGLQAQDDRDGDLTEKIMVERISRFSEPGVCMVNYVVFDSSNNMCRHQKMVCFDDYTPPRLSLEKPLMFHAGGDITFMDRLKLTDCLDGDISHKLKLESSNVASSEVGVYEIEIRAITDYGDEIYARVPVNVISYASAAPIIELKQNLVYVKKGEHFEPKDYILGIQDSNGNKIDISVVYVFSQVDTTKAGAGQVRLEVTDGWGNRGYNYLTVIVED